MKITKQSWFHVILSGILLGGAWIWVFGPKIPTSAQNQVIITNDDVRYLIASWEKTWQRPPSKKELYDAMQGYVKDEVLYREALNRNLDKNNAMVKRSLIMQMNMLAEGQGTNSSIDQESIEAYYSLRKDQYMRPATLSFVQIYFDPDKHGDNLETTLESLKRGLQNPMNDPGYMEIGDPIMLNQNFTSVNPDDVARRFGEKFSESLFSLNGLEWAGPVTSAYGIHLVYIYEQEAPVTASLESVKNEIIREMEFEEKEAAKEQFYTELMRQYSIVYQGEAKALVSGD